MRSGTATVLSALAVFVVAAIFVTTHIRNSIDTDILSLLPDDESDSLMASAIARANDSASSQIVFMIGGGTAAQRSEAKAELDEKLAATGFFRPTVGEAQTLWRWLSENKTRLLCPADRMRLESGEGDQIAREALREWYAPMGMVSSRVLETDPLLLTNRLAGCLLPSGHGTVSNQSVELISGTSDASVFRLDVQDRMNVVVDAWIETWVPQGLSISRAGALFHATYGAEQARWQMSLIGALTVTAILVIYWLMFRSFVAPFLAICMVGYSLTIGLALTLLVFGRIHVMALVFGAALIGMVVDYTSYYFVTSLDDSQPSIIERRAHILRPLSLGMLTSVGSFLVLLAFPVPAFQQIAVLGSAGLVAAWVGTLYLTPLVAERWIGVGPGAKRIERTAGRYLARRPRDWEGPLVLAAVLLVGSALLLGIYRVETLDDVRQFQKPSIVLAAEEARVREATGFAGAGSFFLVRGETADDAVMNEETLGTQLQAAGAGDIVLWAASRLDPSAARTKADAELIRQQLVLPHLTGVLKSLGAEESVTYEQAEGLPALPAFISRLRGQSNEVFWSIVPVTAPPPAALAVGPTWTLVDPAQRYSVLMRDYRVLATWGLIASALATAAILLIVYRRFSCLVLMLPTLAAVVLAPVIAGLLGVPFSFFSAMALFLVAGAGVDYAIFQWEHPGDRGRWMQVGIALAAFITCISIGLLGFSPVLPVQALGITVAIGVFLSLVLSPLVRSRWGREIYSGGN